MDCPLTGSKIPLFISVVAILIAVLTFVFFYNEFYKFKKDISEVKVVKNELNHLGNRLGLLDTCIEELTSKCKSCPVVNKSESCETVCEPKCEEEKEEDVEYIIEEIEVSDDEGDDEDGMSETELS